MGKAYAKEHELLTTTINWALKADISPLADYVGILSNRSLQAIGSGGSYSVANYHSLLHQHTFNQFSKSSTPLDFILNPPSNNVAISFLTASGGNTDVIASWKLAVENDFSHFFALIMRENSKIFNLSLKSSGAVFDFTLSTGRDGFLATNTMMASSVLLLRAYLQHLKEVIDESIGREISFPEIDEALINKRDWLVLSGGWAWPAAIDLESKCSEAALKHVLVSDYRSFGHGRHLWLDKEKNNCAIIAIATPEEMKLVERTFSEIPSHIPRLVLCSKNVGPLATIELFHSVMSLVGVLGKYIGRDPGRPGVPSFGSKLYHLGPSGITIQKKQKEDVWINRKANSMGISGSHVEQLRIPLSDFLKRLKRDVFSGIVVDYDGTLCDTTDRFKKLSDNVCNQLNRLLENGIRLGIATGRGKSAIVSIKDAIKPEYYGLVTIGYYNGACLINLEKESVDSISTGDNDLEKAVSILSRYCLGKLDVNKYQVTITPERSDLCRLLGTVKTLIHDLQSLVVTRSSHSIDIRLAAFSKLSVYNLLSDDKGKVLTIGDCGAPGGNDEDLLLTPYSLSCYEPTISLDSGWHLAPPGCHFSSAALYYLSCIHIQSYGEARFIIR